MKIKFLEDCEHEVATNVLDERDQPITEWKFFSKGSIEICKWVEINEQYRTATIQLDSGCIYGVPVNSFEFFKDRNKSYSPFEDSIEDHESFV
jgi:hypothetical protein